MNFKLITVLLVLVISLTSCEYYRLHEDSKIASQIFSEVNATDGSIYYSHLTVTDPKTQPNIHTSNSNLHEVSTNKEEDLVVLDVHGTNLIADDTLVASYCALQLYKELDPTTIKRNRGFKIIFNGHDDFYGQYKHYYEKEEVKLVWESITKVENYIYYTAKGDTLNALRLMDTSIYYSDFHKLTSSLKSRIYNSVEHVYYFYTKVK